MPLKYLITEQIISPKKTSTTDFDPNSDPLNKYLYDEDKDDNFFDVGRDNFFSTLAFAMEGGGDFSWKKKVPQLLRTTHMLSRGNVRMIFQRTL